MLVTAKLKSSMVVDHSLLAKFPREGEAEVRSNLARRLIAFADERAYKVREESVFIYRAGTEQITDNVIFDAVWSPRKARLIAGEYDGDTITIDMRDDQGYPPEILVLPYREGPEIGIAHSPSPIGNLHPRYERSGIHPIDDIWIYTLKL